MPTWAVRQWQLLRSPCVTAGVLRHPDSTARYLPRAALRPYAQTSHQNAQKPGLSAANSAIVIPASVVDTQPQDLITHIQPVDKTRLTRDRFAVFFVTPSFAPWLLDDRVFLHDALRQTYKHLLDTNRVPYARVHALCAVVDKLPVPKPIGNADNLEQEVQGRMAHPPVSETGFEGLAYATLRFSDSVPSSSSSSEDQAAITFITSNGSESRGYFGDTLRLPLANTVFQTGSPTTMTYSTWEKSKGASDFTLRSNQNVTHHGINIARTKRCTSSLATPLVPLTFPRCVDGSMGNILRRVIGPDGKSVTASQELEKVVPQFFSARGEPSQATTVWALVMPHDLVKSVSQKTSSLLGHSQDGSGPGLSATANEEWPGLWKRDPPTWNDLVPAALASGARLHRVLSGGGGWGKKAGLLSLDPHLNAEPPTSAAESLVGDPEELSSALQQVAQDGDYIQFFISPSITSTMKHDAAAPPETLKRPAEPSNSWGWELGTVASTMDQLPGGSWQHGASGSNDVYVFRHSFGALAEGGMTINRHFKLKAKDPFSLIGGSKVDVPFSRFSVANVGPEKEAIENDSIQNCLEPTSAPYHSVLFRRLYGEQAPPLLGLQRLQPPPRSEPDAVNEHTRTFNYKSAPLRFITSNPQSPIRSNASVSFSNQRVSRKEPKFQAPRKVPLTNPAPEWVYKRFRRIMNHCFASSWRVEKAIEQLTEEHHSVMRTIQRRKRAFGKLAVRTYADPSEREQAVLALERVKKHRAAQMRPKRRNRNIPSRQSIEREETKRNLQIHKYFNTLSIRPVQPPGYYQPNQESFRMRKHYNDPRKKPQLKIKSPRVRFHNIINMPLKRSPFLPRLVKVESRQARTRFRYFNVHRKPEILMQGVRVTFRKYVSPRRAERIAMERKEQRERKREAKGALLEEVTGWLGGGG